MDEIFKQYGGAILAASVVVALIAIVTFLLKSGGPVADIFNQLIDKFASKVDFGSTTNVGGNTILPFTGLFK